jgi:hypothetical protein
MRPSAARRSSAEPAPCVCGRVAVAPVAPCVAPCGAAPFWYQPTRFYAAYWAQPAFTACYPGPGNCYWRRDWLVQFLQLALLRLAPWILGGFLAGLGPAIYVALECLSPRR